MSKTPRYDVGPPTNYWAVEADMVLRHLWAGRQRTVAEIREGVLERRGPTKQEIYDAYPFYERKYWPYKVWLGRVKYWENGCPDRPVPSVDSRPLPGQEALI